MKPFLLLALFFMSLTITGCAEPPPENVIALENGDWIPEDGYAWIDVDNPSAGVVWTPGLESKEFDNVLAANTEGNWVPRVGYWWVDNSEGASVGEVAWDPGRLHPTFKNIVTSPTADNWIPLPGYVWSVANTLSDGVWQPGVRHNQFRNVFAAQNEQTWTVPPGYTFSSPGQLSEGVWSPGSSHPRCPHVFAAASEGQWRPEVGYTFANSDPSDLAVIQSGQSDFEKFLSVAVPFVVGAIAYNASAPQEGDTLLDSAGRLTANAVAEASVDAAGANLAALFPSKC
jgi:hypothetical protein